MKNLLIILILLACSCAAPKPVTQERKTVSIKGSTSEEISNKELYKLVVDNQENIQKLSLRIKDQQLQIDSLKALHVTNEPRTALTIKGAGKNVKGGYGGIVVKVTNLNDSGAGSLRSALLMTQQRVIVFDVSGTIRLNSPIELIEANSNFIVAGQSAPEGGITISNNLIQIGGGWSRASQPCNNSIWQYIRFRNGRYTGMADVREHNGIVVTGADGLVFDHCSFSFCDDQAIAAGGDWGDFKNVTIQHCLFSENATQVILALNGAYEEKDVTVINNAFIDTSQRTPNIGGDGQYDIVNNYYFNWSGRLVNINAGSPEVNFIGNYMKEGLHTLSGSANKYQSGSAKIYTANNYHSKLYTVPTVNDRNIWQGFFDNRPVADARFTSSQYPLLGGVELIDALEVETILDDVGANKYLNLDGSFGTYSDSFDLLKIDNAKNDISGNPYNKSWKLPELPNNKRPDGYDSLVTGIPNEWVNANMPQGAKSNDIAPNGKTYMENYLSGIK